MNKLELSMLMMEAETYYDAKVKLIKYASENPQDIPAQIAKDYAMSCRNNDKERDDWANVVVL